jgi:Fur family ferric uptake transcriptional regulator
VLRTAARPLSHADVIESLAGEPFNRTTLYRNLVDLAEAGLARRVDHGDRTWRFESEDGAHSVLEHPHFVCRDCGQVLCLDGVAIRIERSRGLPRAVRTREVEVHVRGLCDDCGGRGR